MDTYFGIQVRKGRKEFLPFFCPSWKLVLAVVSDGRRTCSSSQGLAAALLALHRVQRFSLTPPPKHCQG